MHCSDLENVLHLLQKITTNHVNLTSYSVMRMHLAAQVLSSTMANVLKNFGPPESAGTAKFCGMLDTFFDCFNIRSLSEGSETRKAFLLPYKNVNNEPCSWLTDKLVHYLSEWHRSIKERSGNFDENAQARMFLSHQTFEGMKMSVYSLIALVKFLLGAGVQFVSTNHFCQDPV